MNKYRIGVIGLGQRIAHVLRAMDEVGWQMEIAGYTDPRPVGAEILAAGKIDAGRVYPDVKTLLNDGPFDLVMIGSPNHLHYEHLLAAFDAGYPIFAEKPIVRTEEETYALARRLREKKAPPLYVGLVMRSMPIVRETMARALSGEIGEIVSIDATEHLPPEHGAYLARNWRRRQEWGGSFMLDKVCHDFDILDTIAGARAARVASFGGKRIFVASRTDVPMTYSDGEPAYNLRDAGWEGANDAFQSNMDVADHQVAIVEYANGVRLSFHSNSHVSLQERRWYISGTTGTIIADLVRNKLMIRPTLSRKKPERIDYANRTDDNHNGADQAMATDLLNTFEKGAKFPVTVEDSMEAGLTVMAIDRAMDRAELVNCADMWSAYDEARAVIA
ncbi:MAG TPA: Gfo/Idh/MocA family oxidoreductase [Rhizomicrobium sp.]|jgi:predicted dehydrogenase|nr:Gfo/Idh/MocA family oxidoreductase [Rhizomicrobium sp.]